MKLAMISLGCAKNQIDTELFLGLASKYNIEVTFELNDADIIVLNTCGFIKSSKVESIDWLLEISNYKEQGKILIAMGCFVQRYLVECKEEFKDIDYFVPISDYDKLNEVFNEITHQSNSYKLDYNNRFLTTLPHSAYLKIAEGCNNRCAFCAIPLIRGNLQSRTISDIYLEAVNLADGGVKELTLIAQDTTMYGFDLKDENTLINLLTKLCEINELKWIRLLYMYPYKISDELLNLFKNNSKLIPYFDIPLQHANDKMLNLMNRKGNMNDVYDLIKRIRLIPNAILRTTFIVGFPKETLEDFKDLYNFIKKYQFDRVGIFKYSDEENTKGYEIKPKVKAKDINFRYKELMKLQKQISFAKNQKLIGKEIEVLVDYFDFDKEMYVCRSYAYAPDDVDGCIYLKPVNGILVGSFYQVKITKATAYDLYAEIK